MIELNGRIASHGFHWRHYFGAKLEVGGGESEQNNRKIH